MFYSILAWIHCINVWYICLLFDTSFFASMLCSSPFLNIVTRATTRERKPNGFLPKLWGVPYKIWGDKIKLTPSDSTTRKELMEPCSNILLVRHLKHWLPPSYVCLTALNDRLWYWSTLVLEMVDIDNNLYGQWTSKMFGQWTLKNMLNVDDTHTRISTIVPDTYLDTYPEFLIQQWFEAPVPDSNYCCSNVELRYLVYCY